MSESQDKKQPTQQEKPLTPEQHEKVYQILKEGFLMRLQRKGLLKPGARTRH